MFTMAKVETFTCAGRGCTEKAVISLQIAVLNLQGFFCQKCANSLLELHLAQETKEEDKTSRDDSGPRPSNQPYCFDNTTIGNVVDPGGAETN